MLLNAYDKGISFICNKCSCVKQDILYYSGWKHNEYHVRYQLREILIAYLNYSLQPCHTVVWKVVLYLQTGSIYLKVGIFLLVEIFAKHSSISNIFGNLNSRIGEKKKEKQPKCSKIIQKTNTSPLFCPLFIIIFLLFSFYA